MEIMIRLRHRVAQVKGLGFLFWHARHELYHALLGVAWAWLLREIWGEFQIKWLLLSVWASLLPDVEHLLYWIRWGKKDPYVTQIKAFLKSHQWRLLTVHIERGHKEVTELSYHNVYIVLFLFILTFIFFLFDWNAWVVIGGAMVIHYIFDIFDDFVTLGYLNSNWKRWGNGKRRQGDGKTRRQ